MIALMHTDLPEPVAPATSMWGIRVRSATDDWPETSRPRPNRSVPLVAAHSSDSITPRSDTREIWTLGTSTPTKSRPGTGASMRIGDAASASDRSLESAWICETRTLMCFSSPLRSLRTITPGRRPNWVTAGPWFTSTTLTGTPKPARVCSMICTRRRRSSCWMSFSLTSSRMSLRTGVRQVCPPPPMMRGSRWAGPVWAAGAGAAPRLAGSGVPLPLDGTAGAPLFAVALRPACPLPLITGLLALVDSHGGRTAAS